MLGVRVIGSPGFTAVEKHMRARGVDVRPMFYPITVHKHLDAVMVHSTKVADLISREAFIVPSYPELTDMEIAQVIDGVHAFARSCA